jgi:hypothetical protein
VDVLSRNVTCEQVILLDEPDRLADVLLLKAA